MHYRPSILAAPDRAPGLLPFRFFEFGDALFNASTSRIDAAAQMAGLGVENALANVVCAFFIAKC
jgi:hypothetical protein